MAAAADEAAVRPAAQRHPRAGLRKLVCARIRLSLGALLLLCTACAATGGILGACLLLAHLDLPVDPTPAAARDHGSPALPTLHTNTRAATRRLWAAPGSAPLMQHADTLASDCLAHSGLTAVRPPLLPGRGGEGFYRVDPSQLLSWQPRVVLFPGFLESARCDAIIAAAAATMVPCDVAWRPGETADDEQYQDARVCNGTFMLARDDPSGSLDALEAKIAAATMLPASHGEPFNIVHYSKGGHYDAHYDFFDPKVFGSQRSQRVATVLIFLSDVEAGGEVAFALSGGPTSNTSPGLPSPAQSAAPNLRNGGCPRGGLPGQSDAVNANSGSSGGSTAVGSGLTVAPRKGDALLFWTVRPDGAPDPASLNACCPVLRGNKHVAIKWLHDREYMP